MKNKELKTLWKLARIIWISSSILWITETLLFLLVEGWHLKATHPIEIYIDGIVSKLWGFALMLTVFICVQYIFNLNKQFNK